MPLGMKLRVMALTLGRSTLKEKIVPFTSNTVALILLSILNIGIFKLRINFLSFGN